MKIDKNIPIPRDNPRNKYPYHELEVGDSFFIPNEMTGNPDNTISASVAVTNKRMKGNRLFICRRRVTNGKQGWRVWRIK